MRNDTKVDKHSARFAHVACLMLFKLKRSVESTHDITDVIQCIQTWLTEQETGSLIVGKGPSPDRVDQLFGFVTPCRPPVNSTAQVQG